MDFWRHSARVSSRKKIRNEVIKDRMNVKNSIVDVILTQKLQWYGHTKRMTQKRLPRRAVEPYQEEGKEEDHLSPCLLYTSRCV